jgi:hypothetical protein
MKKSNNHGWVYILSNPSLIGLVKIGMTTRSNYHLRIKELNSSTSIPTPFHIEYVHACNEPLILEKKLHRIFANKRVNNNREFFAVKARLVIKMIRKIDKKPSRTYVRLIILLIFVIFSIAILGNNHDIYILNFLK